MPSSDRVLKRTRSQQPTPAATLTGAGAGRLLGSDSGVVRAQAPLAPARGTAGRPEVPGAQEMTYQIQCAVREAERRGYEAGRERGEAELAGAVAAASGMAMALEDAAPRQAPVVAALVAELAVAVARRILDAAVGLDPALLRGALERAMEGMNGSPEVRVLLNPAAVEPVRAAWLASHGIAFAGKKWSFDADPTLPIGGCVVRHDHGFVDAGLEAQLAEISAAMDKVVPLVGRSGHEAAA